MFISLIAITNQSIPSIVPMIGVKSRVGKGGKGYRKKRNWACSGPTRKSLMV